MKPKKGRGVDIRGLTNMNSTLLGKWMWTLEVDNRSLWKSIITTGRGRYLNWMANLIDFSISGNVLASPSLVRTGIFWKLGMQIILFWKDPWCRDNILENGFPHFYALVSDEYT